MRTRIVSLAAAVLLLVTPAIAGAIEDIATAPIHAFIDNMNKGDMAAAAAAYAPDATIVDEFPPYRWMGATAFADWGRDYGTDAAKHAITEPLMTLAAPTTVNVDGDHAYAVIPATYTFKQAGKPMTDHGTFSFALTKGEAGWKIAAWAWAVN